MHYRTSVKDETLHFNQLSSTPQLVVLVMALLHYFQSTASLPTAKETTLGHTMIYHNSEDFHVKSIHVQNCRIKNMSHSWVEYENLTCIQLFTLCVKGEYGGAAKIFLH